jgi:hypothetical protein
MKKRLGKKVRSILPFDGGVRQLFSVNLQTKPSQNSRQKRYIRH